MTRTGKLLAELIALPSVNPAFAPASVSPGQSRLFGERNVADFVAATAAVAGLDIEFQPVLPGRANLIAR
ncbi:MAG TPA: M20 family peptidase, partial [Verrucomicrobiae bacterium]